MANYSNPADKLSIIASVPRTVLTKDITIKNLAIKCKELQQENFFLSEEEKEIYEGKLNRRLSVIALDREVSFSKQWWLLYKRMMLYSWRNPISIVFLWFLACFQAFLQSSIFWKVGAEKFSFDRSHDIEVIQNLLGLSFLVCQDQFVTCTFGAIMQIPQVNPVF